MYENERRPIRKRKLRKQFIAFVAVVIIIVISIAVGIAMLLNFLVGSFSTDEPDDNITNDLPDETPEPTPTEIPTTFVHIPNPQPVEGTRPEDFGLTTDMMFNDIPIEEYTRRSTISFGDDNNYTNVEGIITFRGNNFRDTASYGSAGSFVTGGLDIAWEVSLPEVIEPDNPDRAWAGMGWTGQPLVVKWSAEEKAGMNINTDKKDKENLKEVIFGTMGGAIYFLDLDDGTPTRDKVQERWPFRGAGALDPRGVPLFYAGAGNETSEGSGQNLIYSLFDTTELFNYGEADTFRRRNRQAFGGSTIVHAPTDTITYASESNIIYQFTLNTQYNPETGEVSVSPTDMFRWRYSTSRLREAYGSQMTVQSTLYPQYGFESSPVFWREFMFIADNAGHLFCIHLNTFEVIWICDLPDDINASPVLELDEINGRAYIYIGHNALFSRNRNGNTADIRLYKIDAITGEKVWATDSLKCISRNGTGGINATAVLGKNNLNDLVIVPYANVVNESGNSRGTFLVAYDKITGQEVWTSNFGGQCLSSPVDVYDSSGRGYIVFATAAFTNNESERVGGFVHLVDGRTGERLDTVTVQGHIEASPVVYDNMIVIGTLDKMIYGIRIS